MGLAAPFKCAHVVAAIALAGISGIMTSCSAGASGAAVAGQSEQEQLCLPVQDGPSLLAQRGLHMKGKTVVITGGDSGIGYGVAMGLASAGAELIMLGYHEDKAVAAALNISRETGNNAIHVVAPFDLSSLQSVRSVATRILQMAPAIDVLVCDAGVNTESTKPLRRGTGSWHECRAAAVLKTHTHTHTHIHTHTHTYTHIYTHSHECT